MSQSPLQPPSSPLLTSPAPDKALLATLWSTLILVTLWRLWLALTILFHPDLLTALNSALVRWRPLDQFTGWIALTLFALTQTPRPRRRLLAAAIFLGTLLSAASIAWDQSDFFRFPDAPRWILDTGDRLPFFADLYMALIALAILFTELRAAAQALRTGINLLQLWRILTVQWIALWLGCTLYLHLTMSKSDLLGTEPLRALFFNLPALTVLPNVLMTAAIQWWAALHNPDQSSAKARTRAWLITMAALNVGSILLLLRPTWLAIPGLLCMIFATIMFLLGFPNRAWRATPAAPASFILLAFTILMLLAERIQTLVNPFPNPYYSSAWRHLVGTGVPLLFLAGLASLALRRQLPESLQPRGLIRTITILITIGLTLTAFTFLLAGLVGGEAPETRMTILQCLPLGILPEAAALVIAVPLLLRTLRLLRMSPSKLKSEA